MPLFSIKELMEWIAEHGHILPAHKRKKEPSDEDIQRAEHLLKSARHSAGILNTSSEPDTFFPEYQKLLCTLKELAGMEEMISYSGTIPGRMYNELKGSKRTYAVSDFLDRYISKEQHSKRYSVMCKELEKYRELIPEECFARMESLRDQEAQETKRLLSINDRAVYPARRCPKRPVDPAKQDEKAARLERLARMEEKARQEREREELEKKQDEERRNYIRSCDDEELFHLVLEFIDKNIHVSIELLEEYLPGSEEEKLSEFLTRLERERIIKKTSREGAYLCIGSSDAFQKSSFTKEGTPSVSYESFDTMDGLQFEQFCAGVLLKNGFEKVEITRTSGDFGVDVLAEKDGVTYAIQCKCYSGNIGNHAVQEAYSGASYYKRMVPAVMTNQYFTEAAKETARETGVLLWDRNKLMEMIQKEQ